jgi:nitroimidazol reductase NimA-like FMN-containing flavoprotein (pyridoxamine 5'-phosphate oxidase superfamily)
MDDLAAAARDIIDANRYLTLATADGDGRPWASPVWYAHEGYRDFFWVSRPEARHSRNLAERPGLAIVIFDSTVPEGGAQAVYVEAVAEELSGAEQERGIGILSRRSEATEATHGTARTSSRRPRIASTARGHPSTSSSRPTTSG